MSSEGGVVQFVGSEGGVLHPRRVFILVIAAIRSAVRGCRDECWPGSGTRMGCMHAAAAEKEQNTLAGRRCGGRAGVCGEDTERTIEAGRYHRRIRVLVRGRVRAVPWRGVARRRGRAEALLGGGEERDVSLMESTLSPETRRALVRTAKASDAAGRRRPGARVRFSREWVGEQAGGCWDAGQDDCISE
ncbi:hypothetical protein K438DRAFT_1779122 [Mycena galopus ATCC 62051]|nr:hypothetical protein K438DRAFT_1779122 [Mycena galopus ATCC 62051]